MAGWPPLAAGVAAFCMLLGNAAGTSYELLVTVARHKRRVRGHEGS